MIFAQIVSGEVVTVFPCEQNPTDWPGVVKMEEDDPLYLAFLEKISVIKTSSVLGALISKADNQVSVLKGRIDTLEFAISGNDATKAEKGELATRVAQLKEWRQYNLDLSRVPTQTSWPDAPVLPVEPEPY